jgi:hypothetical protein
MLATRLLESRNPQAGNVDKEGGAVRAGGGRSVLSPCILHCSRTGFPTSKLSHQLLLVINKQISSMQGFRFAECSRQFILKAMDIG